MLSLRFYENVSSSVQYKLSPLWTQNFYQMIHLKSQIKQAVADGNLEKGLQLLLDQKDKLEIDLEHEVFAISSWFNRLKKRQISEGGVEDAKLTGLAATPKGLRHGFAIACLDKNIPLTMVQKWMGHTSITTTAIYANATGEEERNIATRLWE